jgi:hypothetical protein
MTVIRTYEDERDLRNDADALDAIGIEVERDGASGADVAAFVDSVIAARKDGYGTGISTSYPAESGLPRQSPITSATETFSSRGATISVTVQFQSFSGGSPVSRSRQRGAVEGGTELPSCPD